MVWHSHLFQNIPQFVVIHTVKGIGIVDDAEVDVFLEFSCFFYDPADVGNLISGCSNYRTIALISHTSKVMLKILQARLRQYMNYELPDVQSRFIKGRGTRHPIANIHWIIKKQKSSRKISTSALLIIPKPLTVSITENWKILKEMGIPDQLTCPLRNLYAGQEATVRTEHGTTD